MLASWKTATAKRAILDFLPRRHRRVPITSQAADRIAAFDNDGTLWVEQPLPPQFDFVFRKWAEEIGGPVAGAAAGQGDHRGGPGVLRRA